MSTRFNRRHFVGGGLAFSAAAASRPVIARSPSDMRWTHEADVVILGSGLSGCVTAMVAHDSDPSASILVVEKMSEENSGGNSRVAGQSMFFPEDIDDLVTYRRALDYPNQLDEKLARTWAEAMVSQHDWIRKTMADVGIQLVKHSYNSGVTAEYPEFPGSSVANGRNVIPLPQTSGVWKSFREQVGRRAIRFMYETQGLELVQNPKTLEVLGIVANNKGKELLIKAKRSVVMCTGGFENNQDMQRNYAGLEVVYPLGTPGNTGDGIKMLHRAGADMWHMRNRVITGGIYPAMKFSEYPCAFLRLRPTSVHSWLEVAKDNRRFWDEARDWNATHYHEKIHGHWVDAPLASVQPVHMIFDDSTRKKHRMSYGERKGMTWNNVVEHYVWSSDNSVEISKGWIVKAGTISELARKLNRNSDELNATVARYNQACAMGNDPEFGRDPKWMSPVEQPPFYAMQIVPGIICTTGGAKRNEDSKVLGQNGEPIPRLYEAGELGSTMGNLYQNGSFLTECIVFGRIAGRNAVAEEPWVSG